MSGIIETLLDEAREKQDLDALVEANQHMLDIIRGLKQRNENLRQRIVYLEGYKIGAAYNPYRAMYKLA